MSVHSRAKRDLLKSTQSNPGAESCHFGHSEGFCLAFCSQAEKLSEDYEQIGRNCLRRSVEGNLCEGNHTRIEEILSGFLAYLRCLLNIGLSFRDPKIRFQLLLILEIKTRDVLEVKFWSGCLP